MSLQLQTEEFEGKLHSIVSNDVYLRGYKEVQMGKKRNPNQHDMFKQDFEMKLARIEDTLGRHVAAVGEQILNEDAEA